MIPFCPHYDIFYQSNPSLKKISAIAMPYFIPNSGWYIGLAHNKRVPHVVVHPEGNTIDEKPRIKAVFSRQKIMNAQFHQYAFASTIIMNHIAYSFYTLN